MHSHKLLKFTSITKFHLFTINLNVYARNGIIQYRGVGPLLLQMLVLFSNSSAI
jgi:hypothetical protein